MKQIAAVTMAMLALASCGIANREMPWQIHAMSPDELAQVEDGHLCRAWIQARFSEHALVDDEVERRELNCRRNETARSSCRGSSSASRSAIAEIIGLVMDKIGDARRSARTRCPR